MSIQYSGLSQEASAQTLVAGDFEAIFLPRHGMLGASLRVMPSKWVASRVGYGGSVFAPAL
jgi:hypothetical protein